MGDSRRIRLSFGGRTFGGAGGSGGGGGGGDGGDEIEGYGARHAISRRLNASVRRQTSRSSPVQPEQQQYGSTSGWSRDQQSGSSRPLYSASGAPISDEEDECSASHAGDRDEEQDPQDFHMVYRGQFGRFVGSGSSQPTSSSAEAWLV
ncbi:zinc finger protein AEBP2-like [Chenopodium quinoa]|uniref:zinc finger protein AEBP2-like n=1 Tax=Chenopodium quinoa TaxID=63459 RepID=UPI000B7759EC|nr:zinc finger protein AEBP2-like [Chenopodium quinoa]